MKKLLISLAAIVTLSVGASFVPAATTGAVTVDPCAGTANSNSALCENSNVTFRSVVKTIIDTLLMLVGAIAVIMIVVSGLRYITSGGNSNSVAAAKNTLLYSVVGLVVAILSYAIVQWVYNQFL